MALTTKTWTFDSDFDGWSNSGAATWLSSDGTPAADGCIQLKCNNFGAGCTAASNVSITDTWTNIFGIPAGSTIENILAASPGETGHWYKQDRGGVRRNSAQNGPYEVWNSAHTVMYHTINPRLSSDQATWGHRVGADIGPIDAAINDSGDTIQLFFQMDVNAIAGGINAPYTRIDLFSISVEYTPPPTAIKDVIMGGIIPFAR